jgi:hypothetical protein
MTRSIFVDPSAHEVDHIEAAISHGSDYCCLKLRLSGDGFMGRRKGEFEIYGTLPARDRLVAVAKAINAAFSGPGEISGV